MKHIKNRNPTITDDIISSCISEGIITDGLYECISAGCRLKLEYVCWLEHHSNTTV